MVHSLQSKKENICRTHKLILLPYIIKNGVCYNYCQCNILGLFILACCNSAFQSSLECSRRGKHIDRVTDSTTTPEASLCSECPFTLVLPWLRCLLASSIRRASFFFSQGRVSTDTQLVPVLSGVNYHGNQMLFLVWLSKGRHASFALEIDPSLFLEKSCRLKDSTAFRQPIIMWSHCSLASTLFDQCLLHNVKITQKSCFHLKMSIFDTS